MTTKLKKKAEKEVLQERLENFRAEEELLSDSYLRIREIVGAYNTKHGGSDRFQVTEKAVAELKARLSQAEAELQRVNQHAFQREESLKKRLQLMGEKVAEFRKIEAFKIFEENALLKERVKDLELCNKNANALIAHQADENENIITHLKEMWRNAEDANIKATEKIAEYHEVNQKRHFRIAELEAKLAAVATEEWDALRDEVKAVREQISILGVAKQKCEAENRRLRNALEEK